MVITIEGLEKTSASVKSKDIPVGQTFIGEVDGRYGLFLRTYIALVYLNDPRDTWDFDMIVHNYRFVDITIKVNH